MSAVFSISGTSTLAVLWATAASVGLMMWGGHREVALAQTDVCSQALKRVANRPLEFSQDFPGNALNTESLKRAKAKDKVFPFSQSTGPHKLGCASIEIKLGAQGKPLLDRWGKPLVLDVFVVARSTQGEFEVDLPDPGLSGLIEMRMNAWVRARDHSGAKLVGTAEPRTKADPFLKWGQPVAGRYTVVLCALDSDCRSSSEDHAAKPIVKPAPTVPPAQPPAPIAERSTQAPWEPPVAPPQPTAPQTSTVEKLAAEGVELEKLRLGVQLTDQDGKTVRGRLKYRANCPLDPMRPRLKEVLDLLYSTACIELASPPNYTLTRVQLDLKQGLIVGSVAWAGVAELTGLTVDAKVALTGNRPGRNCAFNYTLFDSKLKPMIGPEPLVRQPDGLHTIGDSFALKRKKPKLGDVTLKLEPLPGADCRLLDPDQAYSLSPGTPGVRHDGTVDVSVEVYSTKPDVTIVLASFIGFEAAGAAPGSQRFYPLTRDELKETTQLFLEEAFKRYKGVAGSIRVIGFDQNGAPKTLGEETAENLSETSVRKYISKLEFPQRDYTDIAAVASLQATLFEATPKRNARQLVLFGRSGFADDKNTCASYSADLSPRKEIKDSVAIIDFVTIENAATASVNATLPNNLYPGVDCKQADRLHWVFYPQSMDKLRGRAARGSVFSEFFQTAAKMTGTAQ